MRQTEYRRRNNALVEEIYADLQRTSQAELDWLFRQIRYKVRRLDRQRIKIATASPRLQKFDPNQARDEDGKWTDGGKGSSINHEHIESVSRAHSSYETFQSTKDKPKFIEELADGVAEGIGIKVGVKVLDDKAFNEKFKTAKVSPEAAMFGGVSTVTAGYHSLDNVIYLRQSNIEKVKNWKEYADFRFALYHEMGHAYHVNAYGIIRQDKGEYGSGWAEQFADGFAGALGYAEQMWRYQAKPSPFPKENERAKTFDFKKHFNEFISTNKPVSKYTLVSPDTRLQKSYIVSGNLWDFFVKRMKTSLLSALLRGAIKLFDLQRKHYDLPEVVEIDPAEFAKQIEPMLGERIVGVTDTTKRMVGRKVVGWYNSPGQSMQSLVDQLKPTFSESRARLIAQTEVTFLNSQVQLQTAFKSGVTEWWWSTRRDNVVCKKPLVGPDGQVYKGCRELHGKVFQIGDAMPPTGSHPGCRCNPILVPVKRAKRTEPARTTLRTFAEGLLMRKFDEDQPRDEEGRWVDEGGGDKATFSTSNLKDVNDAFIRYFKKQGNEYYQKVKDINSGYCREWAEIVSEFTGSEKWYNDTFSHAFVKHEGLFYDAGTLNGVKDWIDLAGLKNQKASLLRMRADGIDRSHKVSDYGRFIHEQTVNTIREEIEAEKGLRKSDFVESEHPRNADGEFTDKGTGEGGGSAEPAYKQSGAYKEFQTKIEEYHKAIAQEDKNDALNEAYEIMTTYDDETKKASKEMEEDYFGGEMPENMNIYMLQSEFRNWGAMVAFTDHDKAVAAAKESHDWLSAFSIQQGLFRSPVVPLDKEKCTIIVDGLYLRDKRSVDLDYVRPTEELVKNLVADTPYQNNVKEAFNVKCIPEALKDYKKNHPEKTLSPIEYVEECEKHFKQILKDSDVCVRLTVTNLNKVLEQGAYKSVFETARSKSAAYGGGSERRERYLNRRKEAEYDLFGLPTDKSEGRPVYGYMAKKGIVNGKSELLQQYGNVAIVLKDSVRDRTTFTVGDSLDDINMVGMSYEIPDGDKIWTGRGAPSKIDDPKIQSSTAIANENDLLSLFEDPKTAETDFMATPSPESGRGALWNAAYWEAQVAGGFTVSDIKKVTFIGTPPSESVTKKLAKMGIEWGYEEGEVGKMSKADEPTGKLLAKDDTLELYALDDRQGYVVDTETGKRYPTHEIGSILSRGAWEWVEEEDLEKWDESKHPRRKDGEFAPKGQGETGSKRPQAKETDLKPDIEEGSGEEVYGRPQMGRNFDITAEKNMIENGNYTPEQKKRHWERAVAVEIATQERFNDEMSRKDYIDKYIRRGWYPTDEKNPYKLVNPTGTREHQVSNQSMRNYLDVVLNRGEYKANYDLPTGGDVVPERVAKPKPEPKPEPAPEPEPPALKPEEPTEMDGAMAVKKILEYKAEDYNKEDDYLRYIQARAKERKRILFENFSEDDLRDPNNLKAQKAFDDYEREAVAEANLRKGLQENRKQEYAKELLKVENRVTLKTYIGREFNQKQGADVDEGIVAFCSLVSDKVGLDVKDVVFTKRANGRSSYNVDDKRVTLNPDQIYNSTIVHELGHHLEHFAPGVRQAAREFLAKRTQGEKLVPLNKLGRGYKGDEVCKPDKFIDPYVGRIYPSGSTEIVSVGLAEYYGNPFEFAKKDPEHFAFIYDVVHGKYNDKK